MRLKKLAEATIQELVDDTKDSETDIEVNLPPTNCYPFTDPSLFFFQSLLYDMIVSSPSSHHSFFGT